MTSPSDCFKLFLKPGKLYTEIADCKASAGLGQNLLASFLQNKAATLKLNLLDQR